jgi:hypothetical protein
MPVTRVTETYLNLVTWTEVLEHGCLLRMSSEILHNVVVPLAVGFPQKVSNNPQVALVPTAMVSSGPVNPIAVVAS